MNDNVRNKIKLLARSIRSNQIYILLYLSNWKMSADCRYNHVDLCSTCARPPEKNIISLQPSSLFSPVLTNYIRCSLMFTDTRGNAGRCCKFLKCSMLMNSSGKSEWSDDKMRRELEIVEVVQVMLFFVLRRSLKRIE